MQLSFKLLPCIFLTGFVSVFGLGAKTGIIDNYLIDSNFFSEIFTSNETPINSQQKSTVIQDNLPNNGQTPNRFSTKNTLGTSATPTNKFFIDNLPSNKPFSPTLIGAPTKARTAGIDGTGNPSEGITGIDGTGGPSSDIAGIDGTGGPSGDVAGIDGTGGPSSEDITGIDGTGGPKSETPHTVAKVTLATLGTLQIQGDRLIVNGITFQTTDETKTIIDGNTESNTSTLSSGQVVLINGNVDEQNNGIAREIIYTTQISGSITSINSTERTLIVLGQTIILHNEIIFDGTTTQFSDLKVGDMINISGFKLSNGELSATRIERVENNINKLTGSIFTLNEEEKTFTVNQLTINYSNVEELPILRNGMAVDIQGIINSQNTSILDAISIKNTATSIISSNAERIDLEGFITEFTSTERFKVGDIIVSTNLGTHFIGGESYNLGLNTKIEVEGTLSSNNILVAEKVIFLVANITSHQDKSPIKSSTETFQWNNVNAKSYRLVITYPDGSTFYDQTFDKNTTSVTISELPENSALFSIYLYTLQNEFWALKTYKLYGSDIKPSSVLTSHNNGSVLQSTTETFTWSQAENADSYRLQISDYYNSDIIYYDSTFNTHESITITDLPNNGADLNIKVYTKYGNWWSSKDHYIKSLKLLNNAKLTSHINWQKLNSNIQTFTWEDVGAEQYQIKINRKILVKGINDPITDEIHSIILDGSDTSVTLNNLPLNNAEITFQLRTKHITWGGTQHYTFTGPGTVTEAELISHTNKEVLSSSNETFVWNQVSQADEYYIDIRNITIDYSPIFFEDYGSTNTSATISNLPRNTAEVEMTLSTKHNGYWGHKKYRLKGTGELSDAKINSHNHGQIINTPSTTFIWDNVNADAYHLKIIDISKSPYVTIHQQFYENGNYTAAIDNLPKQSTLLIGLSTKHGDWWKSELITLYTDIP